MIIPHERLAPETLESIIESFICREGSDYGEQEVTLSNKVAQVKTQILAEQVVIVFDDRTESINLLPRRELKLAWDFQA